MKALSCALRSKLDYCKAIVCRLSVAAKRLIGTSRITKCHVGPECVRSVLSVLRFPVKYH